MTVLAQPAIDDAVVFERVWLDERSWVDVARGWLTGAEKLHETLLAQAAWRQNRLWRYERWVDEPRVGASSRAGAGEPLDPVIPALSRALQRRYGVDLMGPGLAQYRDGRDLVAFHRDRDLRWLDDTVIAILTLGQHRPWLLRPRANRFVHELPNQGATHDLSPASGDLLVMGGACQVGWEHSVPTVRHPVGPRISLQWRWTSRRGRPVQGPSYRAPRTFSR
ncbi:MAG: alpha-ketoglutarate-dependent dioxygenase AlkB [Acidimicrobiia bacterium]|nr:alpha-ketoglutarate-dependent dioxygenase AlkB [Acidimicrobiia bacterium]